MEKRYRSQIIIIIIIIDRYETQYFDGYGDYVSSINGVSNDVTANLAVWQPFDKKGQVIPHSESLFVSLSVSLTVSVALFFLGGRGRGRGVHSFLIFPFILYGTRSDHKVKKAVSSPVIFMTDPLAKVFAKNKQKTTPKPPHQKTNKQDKTNPKKQAKNNQHKTNKKHKTNIPSPSPPSPPK